MVARSRFGAVVLALGLALALIGLPTGGAGAQAGGAESAFISAINGLRSSRGLAPLQYDGELTGIARSWATQMANAGQISHNPGFTGQVGQNWQKLGENVGVGASVDQLHQAFINSSSHYANLIDPAYTHIGVGVVERNGQLWTAHQFMALFRAPAPPPPPPAPAAPAAPSAPAAPQGEAPAYGSPPDTVAAPTTPTTTAPPPPPLPPPPPPPPPEPAALPLVLADLMLLDQRS